MSSPTLHDGILVHTELRDPPASPDVSSTRDEEAMVQKLMEETSLPFLPIHGYRIRIYRDEDFLNLGDKIDFLASCKRRKLWAATIDQYIAWLPSMKSPWLHARKK